MNDLNALIAEVDRLVDRLTTLHADRLRCRPGCGLCCVDDITVFAVEAERIREHHRDLLETGTPHAPGACAFLDDNDRCRIYQHRPYVCRTQGLPLRWMDEDDEGNIIEMRDICPMNEEGTPVEELDAGNCWIIGPFEERLAELQHHFGEVIMTRVRLRTLFRYIVGRAAEASEDR